MSHITVLFIGTKDDLDYIYENETSDSSSESAAEQAFGYDYLNEEYYEKIFHYKDSFDKESDVYKNEILKRFDQLFEDIIDIRDRDNWSYVNYDRIKKRDRSKEELFNYLEQLPKETPMFLCDGHL